MDKAGKAFVEYVETNELTNIESLQYYKDLFLNEPVKTERYIVATALNEFLKGVCDNE